MDEQVEVKAEREVMHEAERSLFGDVTQSKHSFEYIAKVMRGTTLEELRADILARTNSFMRRDSADSHREVVHCELLITEVASLICEKAEGVSSRGKEVYLNSPLNLARIDTKHYTTDIHARRMNLNISPFNEDVVQTEEFKAAVGALSDYKYIRSMLYTWFVDDCDKAMAIHRLLRKIEVIEKNVSTTCAEVIEIPPDANGKVITSEAVVAVFIGSLLQVFIKKPTS